MAVGEEAGAEGTPRLQGYVHLLRKVRGNQVRELLGGRAHTEVARGSAWSNRKYRTKESLYLEVGELPKTDREGVLEKAIQAIRRGTPMTEVAREYPTAYVIFGRGLKDYANVMAPQREWKTEVIVLVGDPGVRKSRWAREYAAERKYYKPSGKRWDGYDGQERVVMDDFNGWLPYDDLLRVCDRYPLQVETKGAHTQFLARTLIITSNKPPSKWYREEIDRRALYRRINK